MGCTESGLRHNFNLWCCGNANAYHEDLEQVIPDETSVTNVEKNKTFRERLAHIIHTNTFQVIVITLVILDCLVVITELLLDMKELEEHLEDHVAPKILHYCSIGILSLFLIEILVKLYALGVSFFKHKMEVFDAIIVIVSFALDIAFRDKEGVLSGSGLLILLRLWRITRILNSIVLSVQHQATKRVMHVRQQYDSAQAELTNYRNYVAKLEKEVGALRTLLKENEIDDSAIPRTETVPLCVDTADTP